MKRDTEQVIINNEDIDLSRANVTESLSATDFDEQTQSFYVTIDKIMFKRLHEIVQAVLEANGYVLNLENLLACFDNLVFGSRVRLSPKELDSPCPSPKAYLPCIQFNLPSKSKVGSILKLFYKEIETYESELARLQGEDPKKKTKGKTSSELTEEIKQLKQTIKTLEVENKELKQNLNSISRSHANAEKAIVSQNLLPPNLRLAKVREVSFDDRIVQLKSGRSSFSLPITMLELIPEAGDSCLVHIENGQVKGAFFYESKGVPLKPSIAQILLANAEICKLRDVNRNMWVLTAKNDAERQLFSSLKRGMKVILFILNGQIIKLERAEDSPSTRFISRVNERITSFQLITDGSTETADHLVEQQSWQEEES